MLKVKTDTIIRTALLIIALVNQALTVAGKSPLPIENEQLSEIITLGVTIGASVWAWWKNNSFTKKARKADEYLAELKKEA